ncbi:hypothetical protein R4Z09_16310 [Niallia oryzisoli]|uniref:Uncharacterized protein n=1 Tax=Niallia oryzisoli TaxID=1737571 RepID=A0ABZ2CCM3_9BACI
MGNEEKFPFEGDSIQNMHRKSVREVLEFSSTGYGLESVMEPNKGNKAEMKENNNKIL